MVEIKEVLRLWRAGGKKKRIAAQLTLDVKTVRRYVAAAESCGIAPGPLPLIPTPDAAKSTVRRNRCWSIHRRSTSCGARSRRWRRWTMHRGS